MVKKDLERYADPKRRLAYRRKFMRKYMKEYRQKLLKRGINLDAGKYPKLRRRVLEFLGGPKCVNCGCDVLEILEINHRLGGGAKHRRTKGSIQVLYDILSGRLPLAAVEITCKVCNALHYVKMIKKIGGHTVIWSKNRKSIAR